MTLSTAVHAAVRFGLGSAPGDLPAIATDPRGWLHEQLSADDPDTAGRLAARPDTADTVRRIAAAAGDDPEAKRLLREHSKEVYLADGAAHLSAAASSTTPFRERLVSFWGNHLTVSIARKEVLGVAGAFEREVVRAHLDGFFEDLLLASTRHPAMLGYLDNLKSMGPSSRAGQRRDKGLNENLARELLELHTLGVDGGYDQADVLALAKLLTGWSLGLDDGITSRMAMAMGADPSFSGDFGFHASRHEPGPKTLLGKRYPEGEAGGVLALRALAHHPATARHVARRLATHFVADDPPAQAIDTLATAFLDSGGHLPTVHAALVDLPAAWDAPRSKVRTPFDLVIATARAVGLPDEGGAMRDALHALGQAPWGAPSPKGWSDHAEAWTGPAQVLARMEWLERVADTVGPRGARDLAHDLYGDTLSDETAAALNDNDDLWLLLASPEHQRR